MSNEDTKPRSSHWPWFKIGLGLLIAMVVSVLIVNFRGELSLAALSRREADWQKFYQARPVAALAMAFVAYVAVTGLSLPGAAAMSVIYGKLFGFGPALLVVSFASTLGASLAFLMSRYLLGSVLQSRFGERLGKFNAALEQEGPFYLLTLRLIPQAPFFIINVVMGLTPIRLRTFWWISQLGMLPATCVFVFAGASAPSLAEINRRGLGSILSPQLVIALTLLGLLPLVTRWTLRRLSGRSSEVSSEHTSEIRSECAVDACRSRSKTHWASTSKTLHTSKRSSASSAATLRGSKRWPTP